MHQERVSRRAVLGTGAALAVTGGVSGCLGSSDDDGESGTPTERPTSGDGGSGAAAPRVDRVPDWADVVVHVDVARVLEDDLLRQRVVEVARNLGFTQQKLDLATLFDSAEDEIGLDPRAVSEILLVVGAGSDPPAAIVFWADWAEEPAKEAFADGQDLASTTHQDQPIYYLTGNATGDAAMGVTADGAYAIGYRDDVRTIIEVDSGDASPVSGQVRDAYVAAPDGYVRFGFTVPGSLEPTGGSGQVDAAAFRDVTHGYGSLSRTDGGRGGTLVLETASSDAAGAVASNVEAAVDEAATILSQAQQNRDLADQLSGVADSTTISRDGSTVTVKVTDGQGYLAVIPAMVAVVFVSPLGSSFTAGGRSGPVAPTASFSLEYDSEAETVTITHVGGDSIPLSELAIRGEGLDATGLWQDLGGDASGDDGMAVTAGDSVTIGAKPDYEVAIVWESPTSNRSATLFSDQGPGA